MEKVFTKLCQQTRELIVACTDWPSVQKAIKNIPEEKLATYGFHRPATWQITDFLQLPEKTKFAVKKEGRLLDEFEMKLMGRHNALNALACLIVSWWAGIDISLIKKALAEFGGVERRFEIEQRAGLTFIDDYGHHPTEIAATLKAVRDKFPQRTIWCVFQSHTISRTLALLDNFGKSFNGADKVLVVDIFTSARESNDPRVTKKLVESIKKHHPEVVYSGNLQQTAQYLRSNVGRDDVVVTMGAGDVYKIIEKI